MLFTNTAVCHGKLLSDRGTQFLAELVQQVCRILEVKQLYSSGYRPQTNTRTETIHRFIDSSLNLFVHNHQEDWDLYLPFVAFAYRTSVIEGIGKTPFFLVNGREARLPEEIALLFPTVLAKDATSYAKEVKARLQQSYSELRHIHRKLRRDQRDYFDLSHKEVIYKPGEHILLHQPQHRVGLATKLLHQWTLSHHIFKRITHNLYTIEELLTKSKQSVHVQRLSRYTPFEIPAPQEPIEPNIAQHPFNAGEFVFVNDLQDKHKWYVAKLPVVDRGPEEYVIHFYHSYNEKSQPAVKKCLLVDRCLYMKHSPLL